MVKFGGHVEAIREGDLKFSNLYLLNYNEMKKQIGQKHQQQQEEELTELKKDEDVAAEVEVKKTHEEESDEDNKNEIDFNQIWKKALEDAEDDFRNARAKIWQTVFEGIAGATTNDDNDDDDTDDDIIRGVHPGNAIKLYVQLSLVCYQKNKNNNDGNNKAQELLVRMKQVYTAASINSEGLRKIVKKFDKNNHNHTRTGSKSKANTKAKANGGENHQKQHKQLSSTLLPLLYTSSLYTSQNIMYDGIGLLRDLLSEDHTGIRGVGVGVGVGNNNSNYDYNYTYNYNDDYHSMNDDDDDNSFKPLVKRDSELRHQESIDIRMMEIEWLKNLVKSISQSQSQELLLLPKLVAHRGFHNTNDRNDRRPVENSLSAYEMAWTSGVELCECDIALTKDEKLVLAHDENFQRLALYGTKGINSQKRINELTFKELISMPLTSGARPPLLIDVLRSASAISDKSKLIIEIKPGNEVSAFALARLLLRHPELRSSVAMIMSFDASTMHRLRAELSSIAIAAPPLSSLLLDSKKSSRNTMLVDVDTTTVTTPSSNNINNCHRRVTSYDHFGTMSSGWLAGMGISQPVPGGGGGHGLSPSSPSGVTIGSNCSPSSNVRTNIDSSMNLNSIGLSISQMNFNDATPTGALSASAATAPPHLRGRSNSTIGSKLSSAGRSINGINSSDGVDDVVDPNNNKRRGSFSTTATTTMPKLMLLTVADPPNIACELQVQYNELHRVDPWLTADDMSLDGVYLQYQKEMMTPEGAAYLRQLSERYFIGIWSYAEIDPDDFATFEWLVKEGNCSFVNTDLPKHFLKG